MNEIQPSKMLAASHSPGCGLYTNAMRSVSQPMDYSSTSSSIWAPPISATCPTARDTPSEIASVCVCVSVCLYVFIIDDNRPDRCVRFCCCCWWRTHPKRYCLITDVITCAITLSVTSMRHVQSITCVLEHTNYSFRNCVRKLSCWILESYLNVSAPLNQLSHRGQ